MSATVTFNGYSHNEGSVAGSATFNDWSYNAAAGSVAGGVTFNDASYFEYGSTFTSTIAYRTTGLLTIPPANVVLYPLAYGMQGGTQLTGTAQYGINGSGILGMP